MVERQCVDIEVKISLGDNGRGVQRRKKRMNEWKSRAVLGWYSMPLPVDLITHDEIDAL